MPFAYTNAYASAPCHKHVASKANAWLFRFISKHYHGTKQPLAYR